MLALLWLACTTEKDTTTVDSVVTEDSATSGWTIDPSIRQAQLSCDGPNWRFELFTEGWIDAATLGIYQVEAPGGPATLAETHPFPTLPTAYDPFGAWDRYTLALDASVYSAGESTAFYPCILPPGGLLAFRVGVIDRDGAEADCAAWGTSPEAVEPSCL